MNVCMYICMCVCVCGFCVFMYPCMPMLVCPQSALLTLSSWMCWVASLGLASHTPPTCVHENVCVCVLDMRIGWMDGNSLHSRVLFWFVVSCEGLCVHVSAFKGRWPLKEFHLPSLFLHWLETLWIGKTRIMDVVIHVRWNVKLPMMHSN